MVNIVGNICIDSLFDDCQRSLAVANLPSVNITVHAINLQNADTPRVPIHLLSVFVVNKDTAVIVIKMKPLHCRRSMGIGKMGTIHITEHK